MSKTICRCTSCICPTFSEDWYCDNCLWGKHLGKLRPENCPNCGEQKIDTITLFNNQKWRYCRNCEWSICLDWKVVGPSLPINYTEIAIVEVQKKVYW